MVSGLEGSVETGRVEARPDAPREPLLAALFGGSGHVGGGGGCRRADPAQGGRGPLRKPIYAIQLQPMISDSCPWGSDVVLKNSEEQYIN